MVLERGLNLQNYSADTQNRETYLIRVCAGLNVLLLLAAVMLFYEHGPSTGNLKEFAVVLLIFIAPAFTLFTLFAPNDKFHE